MLEDKPHGGNFVLRPPREEVDVAWAAVQCILCRNSDQKRHHNSQSTAQALGR